MIELAEVGCRLGGRWALREVSLRVPQGEVFGLTGPNGGGKSLLLAICATLVRPDTGTVRIQGRDARVQASAVRRLIGYVPEDVGWSPQMTVREDLEFFAGAHGKARHAGREAAAEAMDRWGLRTIADLPMRHASRGFRRRVGLARAWLHAPRVLLLDDPVSGLDSESREVLGRELRRHVENGGCALVASGDPADLPGRVHRIGMVAGGRLGDAAEPRGAADLLREDLRPATFVMDR